MPTIGEDETHVARKDHVCWWCGGKIAKGDIYVSRRGADDGMWWHMRLHPECRAAERVAGLRQCDYEDVMGPGFYRGSTCWLDNGPLAEQLARGKGRLFGADGKEVLDD